MGIGVEVASATCATSVGSSGSGVAVGVGSTGSGVAVGSGVSVESLESVTSLHDVCPGWSWVVPVAQGVWPDCACGRDEAAGLRVLARALACSILVGAGSA